MPWALPHGCREAESGQSQPPPQGLHGGKWAPPGPQRVCLDPIYIQQNGNRKELPYSNNSNQKREKHLKQENFRSIPFKNQKSR